MNSMVLVTPLLIGFTLIAGEAAILEDTLGVMLPAERDAFILERASKGMFVHTSYTPAALAKDAKLFGQYIDFLDEPLDKRVLDSLHSVLNSNCDPLCLEQVSVLLFRYFHPGTEEIIANLNRGVASSHLLATYAKQRDNSFSNQIEEYLEQLKKKEISKSDVENLFWISFHRESVQPKVAPLLKLIKNSFDAARIASLFNDAENANRILESRNDGIRGVALLYSNSIRSRIEKSSAESIDFLSKEALRQSFPDLPYEVDLVRSIWLSKNQSLWELLVKRSFDPDTPFSPNTKMTIASLDLLKSHGAKIQAASDLVRDNADKASAHIRRTLVFLIIYYSDPHDREQLCKIYKCNYKEILNIIGLRPIEPAFLPKSSRYGGELYLDSFLTEAAVKELQLKR